jgi:hypothetical protein
MTLNDDPQWARLRDRLFTLVAVAAVVAFVVVTYFSIATFQAVGEFNRRQIEVVKAQNDVQICAQYEITLAVREVARRLGLPWKDIALPSVGGIDCEAF